MPLGIIVAFLLILPFRIYAQATPTSTLCGGFNGIICPTGYECIYSNGNRIAPFPDASGTCTEAIVKTTPTGEPCTTNPPSVTLTPQKTNRSCFSDITISVEYPEQ
jgi:hypothetical protein